MPTRRSSTRRLPWCRSYVAPPGVRVPSRTIAPGIALQVPAEVLAAEALRRRHLSAVAEHRAHGPGQDPVGDRFVDHRAARPAGSRSPPPRRRAGRCRRPRPGRCASQSAQATASRIRTVPDTRPWSGITLGAAPACRLPHTTLTPARGSIRRLSTAGSSVVTLASAKVRSPVRWGRLVWPPRAGQPHLDAVGGAGRAARAGARPDPRRRPGRSAARRSGRPRRGRPRRAAARHRRA